MNDSSLQNSYPWNLLFISPFIEMFQNVTKLFYALTVNYHYFWQSEMCSWLGFVKSWERVTIVGTTPHTDQVHNVCDSFTAPILHSWPLAITALAVLLENVELLYPFGRNLRNIHRSSSAVFWNTTCIVILWKLLPYILKLSLNLPFKPHGFFYKISECITCLPDYNVCFKPL